MKFAVQIAIALCAVSSVFAGSYGPDYGNDGGYGSGGYGKGPEGPSGGRPGRVVQAALQTKHSVRYVNVNIPSEDIEPQIIEVGAQALPIIMHFKSASSRIRVQQSHSGSGASQVQQTTSEDQPLHLRHEVTKPIIQEVREIVLPYRKVIQEIRPVREEIETIVAKKSDSDEHKEPISGGITGSVSQGQYGGGIKGSGAVSGSSNVKRSTRWSTNYGRY